MGRIYNDIKETMKDKDIKDIYYMARYNMNKCIRYEDESYKIAGFRYIDKYIKGFIVIDSNRRGYNYKEIQTWWNGSSINKIFLKDKNKYLYGWIFYPLKEYIKIVENKNEL